MISSCSIHPLLSFSRPAPMLYLHIACLPPSIVLSFSPTPPPIAERVSPAYGWPSTCKRRYHHLPSNAYLYAAPPPYLRRFSSGRRTPLVPPTLLDL